MSTITKEFTKEQLQQIIETDHVQCGEASSLARIALASLEAKPIGAFHIADQQVDGTSDYIKDGEWPIDDGVIEVYAAPPAPVSVPDLKPVGFLFVSDDGAVAYSPADWPMKGFNLIGQIYGDLNACRAAMLQGADGNSPVIPDGWTRNDKANAALMMLDRIETVDPVDDDRIDGIKRIVRELAAAPHDTPALNSVQSVDSVADRWIPVSERMPNDKDFVWCWGYVSGWTESDGFEAYYDATRNKWWTIDDETVRKVTHWMPLPAAPQQEVK